MIIGYGEGSEHFLRVVAITYKSHMYNMHVRLKCHVLTSASLVISIPLMIMYGIEAYFDGRLNHRDENVMSKANACCSIFRTLLLLARHEAELQEMTREAEVRKKFSLSDQDLIPNS